MLLCLAGYISSTWKDRGMSRQYSVTEAASELGVHVNTLRKWVDKGRVAAIVLPTGRRRFTQEQLDQIKRDIGILPKALAA